MLGVESKRDTLDQGVQERWREFPGRRRVGLERRQVGADLAPHLRHLVTLLAVERGDTRHDLFQAWQALALLRREVGRTSERRAFGGEEHGQGPATPTLVQGHVGMLIARIDVWTLVTVDFDGDKVLVDQRRDSGVLITLAV